MTSPPPSIGPYTILEILEAGAFTVTYRASQPRIGRAVRLKALKATVSIDSPFAAELTREAAILGRLDHEGAIRLHDFVRAPDALYLVCEDVRGARLSEIIAAARLPPAEATAIAVAVARTLGHAHASGVVHRALAASLVLLTPRGRVVIADFSAAAAIDAAEDDLAPRTESPTPPSYLSPEQIVGEPATPRSDVWALGVLLHELLAGSRPFDADDPRLSATRIRSEAAPPLPEGTPSAIARIVARCLAKDADDRYPDAGAVAAALEEALEPLTRAPLAVLATRALEAANLGVALPSPAGARAPDLGAPAPGPDVLRAARDLAVVFALLIAGALALRLLAASDEGAPGDGVAEPGTPPSGPRDRGYVRVVARPWAEVFVDGQLVDTTPIGKPISIPAGKHFITFRHPSAPDEQRSIKVAPGQTVFLDVSMRIDRGDAGAPADAGLPPASP